MIHPNEIDLTRARIYAETPLLEGSIPLQYREPSDRPTNLGKALGQAMYGRHAVRLKAYIPARHSPTGKPVSGRVPYSRELRRMASDQLGEREKRKQERETLEAVKPKRKRGRPREHAGHELLESMGAYRRGQRIHFRRDVPLEDQAKARYALLSPEWREALSEDEFIEVERRVVSLRKRANRMRQQWDEDAAYQQALKEVLDKTEENSTEWECA